MLLQRILPLTASVIIEAEDMLIEQPSPSNLASVTIPSSTCIEDEFCLHMSDYSDRLLSCRHLTATVTRIFIMIHNDLTV